MLKASKVYSTIKNEGSMPKVSYYTKRVAHAVVWYDTFGIVARTDVIFL